MAFRNINVLGREGEELTSGGSCIDLDRSIWFMMERLMCKKHQNVYEKNVYYIRNDIPKTFKMVIIEYAERVCRMFELAKLLPPPFRKN